MEIYKTWKIIRSELFTPEEISGSNLRVSHISELIKSRKDCENNQKELERLSSVK